MTPELITAIIACLGALTAFLKARSDVTEIKKERTETKTERDRDSQELHDKVIKLECTCETHKTLLARQQEILDKSNNQIFMLNNQLAKVIVKMENIIDCLKELKDDFKDKGN